MKKIILVLVLMTLFGCTNKKSDAVIIGLDDTFAPMGFKDEQGNYTGFDIELATAVFDYLGEPVTFKSIDWNSALLELNSKRIDLIWNGMTITEERLEKMAISSPYFTDEQAIYVLDNSSIKSISDLKNKVIGLQLGSSAEIAFNDNPISSETKEVIKYQDNTQALLDLKAGRVDAVVVDSVVGDYYISKQSGYVKLSEAFMSEQFGIGARTSDKELIERIDEAIEALKANGEYQKIYDRWFKNND